MEHDAKGHEPLKAVEPSFEEALMRSRRRKKIIQILEDSKQEQDLERAKAYIWEPLVQRTKERDRKIYSV